jgi:galactose mutarotase-like enzyme
VPFLHEPDDARGLDLVRGPGADLLVRRHGAEAIGLTVHDAVRGDVGLLWRNAETGDPPQGWKNHATVLFPIVGDLVGGVSRTLDGTEVRFPRLHGFARQHPFALVEASDRGDHFLLSHRLTENGATLAQFPWRCTLEVAHRLHADRLEHAMTVTNTDTRPMPYQIGWHPGFQAPFVAGAKADCHLRLPEGRALRVLNDERCFLTGERVPVDLAGDFRFTEADLERTYMFDLSATPPARRVVTLTDPDGGFGVRVRFPDYPHLGLWSDADAPFLCIEPWQGMDDHAAQEPFDRKFGVRVLAPGRSATYRATIEWGPPLSEAERGRG